MYPYSPQIYEPPAPPPDAAEKKMLRKYYFRLAWIVIALLLVFDLFNQTVMTVSAAIIGGGFTKEAVGIGKETIRSIPLMKAIYSYGFPIAGDIAALGTGIIITKADIKGKLRFRGFTGGELCKFTALSFGAVTVGSLVNMIILAVIALIIGGSGDSDINSLMPSAVIPENGNPLWLDVMIYLYMCILGPILEELIFRGVLLEGLRKYGNAFGIIMSAILFGLMHQNFAQCIPAVCIGIIWGAMAVKSGSLLPSIFVHIMNNTLSAILMVMMESLDASDIYGMAEMLLASAPLLISMMLNVLFRLVCIVVSMIIVFRYIGSRRKLISVGEYSKKRTWSYIFTSAPWLIAIAYMLFETVTSINI